MAAYLDYCLKILQSTYVLYLIQQSMKWHHHSWAEVTSAQTNDFYSIINSILLSRLRLSKV